MDSPPNTMSTAFGEFSHLCKVKLHIATHSLFFRNRQEMPVAIASQYGITKDWYFVVDLINWIREH